MNKEILKGRWTRIKGELQKNWGQLTDDEINQIDGETSRLIGLLQEKYGFEKEKAENEIETFLNNLFA